MVMEVKCSLRKHFSVVEMTRKISRGEDEGRRQNETEGAVAREIDPSRYCVERGKRVIDERTIHALLSTIP